MCPGSMPLYGVSTSSVRGFPTVHVDALEIWLTLLVGELFRLFFEVINVLFTFFKPEETTSNYHQQTHTHTQKKKLNHLNFPTPFFTLFERNLCDQGSLVINVTRTPGMGSIPNIRRTWTCECPPPTKTKSLMMGVLAKCVAKTPRYPVMLRKR